MPVNRWWTIVLVIAGAAIWFEAFLRYPLYSVVVLAAIGGWWDYMRRRSKLKPR